MPYATQQLPSVFIASIVKGKFQRPGKKYREEEEKTSQP